MDKLFIKNLKEEERGYAKRKKLFKDGTLMRVAQRVKQKDAIFRRKIMIVIDESSPR